MTRFARIKKMTRKEMAQKIIKLNFTDEYCKGDCHKDDCPHELKCVMRWLREEVGE